MAATVADASVFHVDGFDSEAQDHAESSGWMAKQGAAGGRKPAARANSRPDASFVKRRKRGRAQSSSDDASCKSGDSNSDSESDQDGSPTAHDRLLALCMDEWAKHRRATHDVNESAFQVWLAMLENAAASAIKGADLRELCAFFTESYDEEVMSMAVAFAGLNAADNGVSFAHLREVVMKHVTPLVAVIGPEEATSTKVGMEHIASQLVDALEAQLTERKATRGGAEPNALEVFNALDRHKRRATLRSRSVPPMGSTDSRATAHRDTAREQSATARRRKVDMHNVLKLVVDLNPDVVGRTPAVVIFRDAGNMDPQVLRELTKVLMHFHSSPQSNLWMNTVLGLQSWSYLGADGIFSRRETCMLRIRKFKAANPKRVMDELFERLFIDAELPLRFSPNLAAWLSDLFMSSDFSVHAFLRAVRLAGADHFRRHSSAYFCMPATDPSGLHPIPNRHIDAILSLKSVRAHAPPLKGQPDQALSAIRGWIHDQQDLRSRWPRAFRATRIVARVLGELRGGSEQTLRADLVMLASNTLMSRLLDSLRSCEMATLESLVESLADVFHNDSSFVSFAGHFKSTVANELAAKSKTVAHPLAPAAPAQSPAAPRPCALERTRSRTPGHGRQGGSPLDNTRKQSQQADGENGPRNDAQAAFKPAAVSLGGPGASASKPTGLPPLPPSRISKAMQRQQLREQHLQTGRSGAARKLFLEWWEQRIVPVWEARKQPLGELFITNHISFLKVAFNAQPRATVASTLDDSSAGTDASVAFQILQGHKRQRTLPLLLWYKEFCSVVERGRFDPNGRVVKARFLQAVAELEFLGFTAPATKSSDSVRTLVHTAQAQRQPSRSKDLSLGAKPDT